MDGMEENPYMPDGEQKLFYLSKKTVWDLDRLAKEAGVRRGQDVFVGRPDGNGRNGEKEEGSRNGGRKEDVLPRFAGNGEMQHLEKYLFRYPVKAFEGESGAIHLAEASSPEEEIRQVCIRIRELVQEEHYCYRDFAIVTGDLLSYAGHVEAEAEKFGIPVYLDQTKGILLNPFIEYIRSALKIVMENFSYRAVFHYLRSGLTGFSREDTDI